MKYIIHNGIIAIGVFNSKQEAREYKETKMRPNEWIILVLIETSIDGGRK